MSFRQSAFAPAPTFLSALGLAACLVASNATAKDDLRTEKAVIQTLHDTCKAYERGNTRAMTELLTEDFTLTNSTGVVTTRADDIDAALKGTVTYEVFENRDMKARLHGDAAIVTGRTIVKGASGKDSFDAEFQFTDTLVLQDGRWKVASSHVSLLTSNLEKGPVTPER